MPSAPKLPATEMVQKLLTILTQFRAVDPEFPLQYAICLCEISLNPGISLTQISEKTGLALSTISRIVGALSDYRPNGAPYGLVRMDVAPNERRRRELRLTDDGAALLSRACAPMAPITSSIPPVSLKTVW